MTVYEAIQVTSRMRCMEPGQLEELVKPSKDDDDCTLHGLAGTSRSGTACSLQWRS